jgi:hypothetical protein
MQRILPALGLLCFSIASQGAIYKWVDEDGVTQFSQFPPSQQQAEQVRGAPPPADDPAATRERLQERLEAFDERREAEAESREEQAAQKERQALRQRNCEAARHNLEILQRGRPRVRTETGEVTYLDEGARQERLEAARRAVQENCD